MTTTKLLRNLMDSMSTSASSPPSPSQSKSSWEKYQHSTFPHNSTTTLSVTIRVTPNEDYLISWGILWACFILTSCLAAYQVWRDHKITQSRNEDIEAGSPAATADEGMSTADVTRTMVSSVPISHDLFTWYVVMSTFDWQLTKFFFHPSI